MREKRSFTGIGDNPHEDEGIQESMGPICDRWNEHLAATDECVIHLRRRMLDAVRDFQQGGTPPGADPSIDYGAIRAYRKLLPKDVPWQNVADYPVDDLVPDYAEAMSRAD